MKYNVQDWSSLVKTTMKQIWRPSNYIFYKAEEYHQKCYEKKGGGSCYFWPDIIMYRSIWRQPKEGQRDWLSLLLRQSPVMLKAKYCPTRKKLFTHSAAWEHIFLLSSTVILLPTNFFLDVCIIVYVAADMIQDEHSSGRCLI